MIQSRADAERQRLLAELQRAREFHAAKRWELDVARAKLTAVVRALNRLDGRKPNAK